MTLASALFGGGAQTDYVAGALYRYNGAGVGTGAATPNEDNLVPFSPRKTVTVDKVAWYRDNTTAANVYVGIYSLAGTLLTDCAVDADTTVGWHLVDTTNVTLIAGRVYYACINMSADVAGTQDANDLDGSPGRSHQMGQHVQLGIAASNTAADLSYVKARTNAALLSSLTLSGWAEDVLHPGLGFVPA